MLNNMLSNRIPSSTEQIVCVDSYQTLDGLFEESYGCLYITVTHTILNL